VLRTLQPQAFADETFGAITVKDILAELEKPGRDPRPDFKVARFNDGVEDLKDLQPGMTLEGTVSNVAQFGAFVDLGVHQDGLVHVSQLADRCEHVYGPGRDVEWAIAAGTLYLRTVGPLYGFFGLGLVLYFASQGAGRLKWPVLGNLLRLALAAGAGWAVLRLGGSLGQVFVAQGAALFAYGCVIAGAIACGAWFGPLRWGAWRNPGEALA